MSTETESKTDTTTTIINNTKNKLIEDEIKSYDSFMNDLRSSLWRPRTQNSTYLDIIAIYLKGQKIIYIESKSHCESLLYRLMLPAIAISSICTVLSLATTSLSYGSIIVSSLTSVNSFILAIISYLKLDGKAESYRVSAYKFEKLETKCEFFSGKILYSNYTKEEIEKKLMDFIEQLEKDIEEIKEVNQFIIPQPIRYRYPILYSTNVFSEIKKRGNAERLYGHELNLVYDKISKLYDKNSDMDEETKKIYNKLNQEKEDLIIRIIRQRDSYLDIDKDLSREIIDNINKKRRGFFDYLCCRRSRGTLIEHKTPQYQIDVHQYINRKHEDIQNDKKKNIV